MDSCIIRDPIRQVKGIGNRHEGMSGLALHVGLTLVFSITLLGSGGFGGTIVVESSAAARPMHEEENDHECHEGVNDEDERMERIRQEKVEGAAFALKCGKRKPDR